MYKCLPIATDLQEMMVMLKSLPAYTLVFDKNCNLVDLNKPALQLLKINDIEEFNERKDEVFPTHDYISTIIYELRKGKTVRHAKTLLKYAGDSKDAAVELCACMINGCQDLFLFQLFEISLSTHSGLGTFSNDTENINVNHAISLVDDSTENAKVVCQLPTEKEQKECWTNNQLVKVRPLKLRKPKYRELSEQELIVSELIDLNMSVPQIASATNKKNTAIRSILRRVVEKQRMNSMVGLGDESQLIHNS